MVGEVVGSVLECELFLVVFEGCVKLVDVVLVYMSLLLWMIGVGELVSVVGKVLCDWDVLMVVEEGKLVGVIIWYDLLGFLLEGVGWW